MKKVNKKPINKGIAKTPVIMQLEALECGAACLAMVCAYYGKWIPLEKVRSDCGVSRDGTNAKCVIQAALHYGLEAKGYRYEVEDLKAEGSFPCIIHWNFNHFVVLTGFKGKYAYINDPGHGERKIPMDVFDESFTGICLEFAPTEKFEPSGKPRSVKEFALERLKGSTVALVFVALTSIITAVIGAINPVFSRIFMDNLLTQNDPDWLLWFIIALASFNVIQVLMSAITAIYNLRINGKMATVGNASYMWKVLNLPLHFFSQRMAGDIQGRQASNANIANTLINIFAPLFLNVAMMVFYLVVMIRYSWILSLVGIGSIIINSIVSRYISKKRINITRASLRDGARLSSATVSGIQMVETIKSSGAENGYFQKWSGYQANENNNEIKFLKLNQYLGMIPEFVSTLASTAVLILGVFLTIKGNFTVGMVMAFQGFLTSFMAPAQTMISSGQAIQEMRSQMERIEDVMEYPEDHILSEEEPKENDEKLSGHVEIKNLYFGYSPLGDPLIKDFNLTIEPRKSVAIVGSSGCGKSTMSKLLSGLYKPWSGEILFDGKPLDQINKDTFRGSLAVVDQDVILFEDTIENNIKMFDDSIEDFEMLMAAKDAQIHEEISARPDGYQHRVIEGGKDFSGGQRQRIEIARVLAQDPTIIILDEATSALDAKTEYNVVNAIKMRGIACVVIAHRLSTIRSCDEIVVLDHGVISARGTHDELMESCELYRSLVTSE